MVQDDKALLVRLKRSGLDFIVIGGVCASYHGSPMTTLDLDICCPFGEENVLKIEDALKGSNPVHRMTSNKLPLEVTRSAFGELKNVYLQTDLGILDCLGEVAGIGNFDECKKQSITVSLSYGQFLFLSIDALIASKNAAGRPHDIRTVNHLLAAKEKRQQQGELF